MHPEDQVRLKAEIISKFDDLVFGPYDDLGNPEEDLPDGYEENGAVMYCDVSKFRRQKPSTAPTEAIKQLSAFVSLRVNLIIESKGLFPRLNRDVCAFWLKSRLPKNIGMHLRVAVRCARLLLGQGTEYYPSTGPYFGPRIAISCGRLTIRQTSKGTRLEGPPVEEARRILKSSIPWKRQLLLPSDLLSPREREEAESVGEVKLEDGRAVSISALGPAAVS